MWKMRVGTSSKDQGTKRIRLRRIGWATLIIAVIVSGVGLWMRYRPAKKFQMSPPTEGELRVVTWNVGYFTPMKIKSAHSIDTTTIAEILHPVEAHLIILQEIGSNEQAEQIAQTLGKEWKAHSIATGLPDQFITVLSSLPSSKMQVREAGGKKMLGLELKGPNDEDIFLLALHAPHPARSWSNTVEYIRAGIAWLREGACPTKILAGDLNYHFSTDRSREDTNLLYREICDLCADSTAAIGKTYYAHTRLDHIFHSPKELEVVASGSGLIELSPQYAHVPGWRDHRPIVVTLRLP